MPPSTDGTNAIGTWMPPPRSRREANRAPSCSWRMVSAAPGYGRGRRGSGGSNATRAPDTITTHKMYWYILAGHTVRIPAELAYERSDLELEIERCGDELRIRPAGRPITGALQALAAFSPSCLAAGREQDEQQERESL